MREGRPTGSSWQHGLPQVYNRVVGINQHQYHLILINNISETFKTIYTFLKNQLILAIFLFKIRSYYMQSTLLHKRKNWGSLKGTRSTTYRYYFSQKKISFFYVKGIHLYYPQRREHETGELQNILPKMSPEGYCSLWIQYQSFKKFRLLP